MSASGSPPSISSESRTPPSRMPAHPITTEDDIDALMVSSPAPEEDDNEDLPSSITDGQPLSNLEDGVILPTSPLLAGSNGGCLMTSADIRAELVKARCLSACQKLHPYQVEVVESFVKVTSYAREVEVFIKLCAIENKLDAIVSATPAFTVTPPLLENIKSYCLAVLLSAKLSAYKGSVPCNHVFAIVLQERAYIPENIECDTHVKKVVYSAIQDELMQARSKIKKAITSSISSDGPSDSDTIYDLATSVITNTKSSITVPLCAQLAFLHKVYYLTNDATYWDKVDTSLALIHTKAGKETRKITRAFERILDADREVYGDTTTYEITDADANNWQTNIDSVIVSSTSSTPV